MSIILLEAEIQNWSEKCAEYSEKHGKENPDLLVEYGKALFALAKQTATMLNNETEQPLPMKNPNVKLPEFDEIAEEEEEKELEAIIPPKIAKHNDDEKEVEKVEEATEKEEADDENEDDFTAAFEILDMARVLYSQMEQTDEIKKKVINLRQLQGDVSLEDDNLPQAVDDYLATIELKKRFYGPESGELSVTEYTLSLAYDALGKQEEWLTQLRNAAKHAKSANLPSADELEQRLADAEEEVKLGEKLKGSQDEAKLVTKEGITGRKAIGDAIQSIVQSANDISGLTRKRKRDNKSS